MRNDYTFEEKSRLVDYLFSILRRNSGRNILREGETDQYSSVIIDSLHHLPKESRELLMNDYFYRISRNWWQSYYSKSTYYRMKNAALDEMLDGLKW